MKIYCTTKLPWNTMPFPIAYNIFHDPCLNCNGQWHCQLSIFHTIIRLSRFTVNIHVFDAPPPPPGSTVSRYSKLVWPIKLTLLELHSKAVQQVSRWSDYAPLAASKGEHWGEFEGGKALPPGDCLNCVRAGPGFCRVESSLLIKAEPQECLGGAGYYSPWSYCTAVSQGS